MVFVKPIEDLKFSDIERLKTDKICESQILDYKERLLEDNKLLKQVSAFANTQGGFLIFGVKETRRGGYPEEIHGIDKSEINKERMEQIVLGNIHPRLNLKIHLVDHQDQAKAIAVVQIPNSYLKPHMNLHDNKFYKRYQFQATPMTEIEVNDAYRRRFAGYEEVRSYVSELLPLGEFVVPQIVGQIVIIPTVLKRMIDTSNMKEFDWMNGLHFIPKYPSIFRYFVRHSIPPTPSPNGLSFRHQDTTRQFEIHRNGCVHSKDYFGQEVGQKMYFMPLDLCVTLLHALQFASALYQEYNYFGNAQILCKLNSLADSVLRVPDALMRRFGLYKDYACQTGQIEIVREFPTSFLEAEYEYLASGIMDEIFNSYGLWKCPFFDDEGKLKPDILKSFR